LTPDGGEEILTPTGSGGWELFMKIDMEDLLTTGTVDFDQSGRVLYMLDSRGRDTASLSAINLDTGEVEVLAENPRADLSRTLIRPTDISGISGGMVPRQNQVR
jgi:hypothetical protein